MWNDLLVVAFVPVDDTHSIMYLRYFQRVMRVPVLRNIFCWVGVLGSRCIAGQDKTAVSQQLPKKTDLRMSEKPIPGDRLLVAYRRYRKELQEAAQRP